MRNLIIKNAEINAISVTQETLGKCNIETTKMLISVLGDEKTLIIERTWTEQDKEGKLSLEIK